MPLHQFPARDRKMLGLFYSALQMKYECYSYCILSDTCFPAWTSPSEAGLRVMLSKLLNERYQVESKVALVHLALRSFS